MSFQDRVKKAKKERQGFKFPEGVISSRFLEHKFGKSRNGDDMFTLIFKPLTIKTLEDSSADKDEIMETIKEKNKKIEVKCLCRLDFQFDAVLEFISDAGMDLSDCNEKDKKYTGVRALLSELEELRPKVEISVKNNEDDDRYVNYKIREVEVVGSYVADEDEEEEPVKTKKPSKSRDDEDDEDEEPVAPKRKAPKPPVDEDDEDEEPVAPKRKKTKRNEDGDSYDDLIEAGWKHKDIAKHYPELV